MKSFKSLLLGAAAISLLAISCQSYSQHGGHFDFRNDTPLEFIEFLRSHQDRRSTYTVRESYRGWIIKDDIPKLIELLDSNEPCLGVMAGVGSYIPGISTVGDQAAFMILAYQKGYYPPSLNTTKATEIDKENLRNWWRIHEKSIDVRRGER